MNIKPFLSIAVLSLLLIKLCSGGYYYSSINKIVLTLTDDKSKTLAQCRLQEDLLYKLPRYKIKYHCSISANDAQSFFCRVVDCITEENSKKPFIISFRLYDCPEWGKDYYYFCQTLLNKQGLSVSHDDIEYNKERAIYQQYIKHVLNSHKISHNKNISIRIDDFYIDNRNDPLHPTVLGDVYVFFNLMNTPSSK